MSSPQLATEIQVKMISGDHAANMKENESCDWPGDAMSKLVRARLFFRLVRSWMSHHLRPDGTNMCQARVNWPMSLAGLGISRLTEVSREELVVVSSPDTEEVWKRLRRQLVCQRGAAYPHGEEPQCLHCLQKNYHKNTSCAVPLCVLRCPTLTSLSSLQVTLY